MRILSIREQRVILDADLAALHDVPTERFNEAVKRNLAKFLVDFVFTLTDEEFAALRSQGEEGLGLCKKQHLTPAFLLFAIL